MSQENTNPQSLQQDENELRTIRLEKLSTLKSSGADPFEITTAEQTALSAQIKAEYDKYENQTVSICGRIIARRIMGKASFMTLQDGSGRIQSYVSINDVGEQTYTQFKKLWDIGDIVEVKGYVFKTKTQEISVHASALRLLSKSLLPLPEKFHGLKDTDTRYRQRYVDLIVNPDVRDTFIKRSRIISSIRKTLDDVGFIEVETPILNTIPGGATARPFITHHNTLDMDLYMRIATELFLKRLIVGGMERVYEMGRIFRNEGMDIKHNPEFTTIELYQAYTDYNGMMDITEKLIRNAALDACGTTDITFCSTKIDLGSDFARITMLDAVKKYAKVDFAEFRGDNEKAVQAAKKLGLEVAKGKETWGDILNSAFEEYVEDKLVQPTFIIDYPVEVSPLTKKKPDFPELTERFELFVMGTEYANAYSELNDPIDQMERFRHQLMLRDCGDEEANMLDDDFVRALEYGMPPTGGMGMGIDRLVMLLTDNSSIRDVLLFPTMKTLKTGSEQNGVQKSEEAATEAKAPEEAPAVNPADPKMPIFDAKLPDKDSLVIEPLFEDFVDFETFSKSDFRAVKVLECVAVPKSKKLLQFTLDDGSGVNRTILSGIHAYYEPEELVGKTCIAITNLPPRKMMGIDSCGMLISAVHKEGEEEKLHLLMVDPSIPAGAKLY